MGKRSQQIAPIVRRFELVDNKSSKYWEINVNNNIVTTRWGRLGASGQTQVKDFGTPAQAVRKGMRQIEEKLGKGYTEVGIASFGLYVGSNAPIDSFTNITRKNTVNDYSNLTAVKTDETPPAKEQRRRIVI